MREWVAIKQYAAMFEAELDQQLLEQSGIPVLLKGPITGVVGPGFAGPTAHGVTLHVPSDQVAAAAELLEDDVQ